MNISEKTRDVVDPILENVSGETYNDIPDSKVAEIIKEHHDVRVTDTLIENYIQLAATHMFSVDPVVQKIRSLNKIDRIVERKIHYVLSDDTIVAISEKTQERLNNLLQNQNEIIDYMRESKDNFLHVLSRLEE